MERSGSHRKPEGASAKLRFLQFVCIAKRVAGHGVNSNAFKLHLLEGFLGKITFDGSVIMKEKIYI